MSVACNPRRDIHHHLDEDTRLPLEHGAAGTVLRACSAPAPDALEPTRLRGYAVSLGERDPEIAALAVPVSRADGSARGALSVSGLISHFDQTF